LYDSRDPDLQLALEERELGTYFAQESLFEHAYQFKNKYFAFKNYYFVALSYSSKRTACTVFTKLYFILSLGSVQCVVRIPQFCGSASLWCGSGSCFSLWSGSGSYLHFDAYPDPDPSFPIMSQNLEKVLKYAHNPYILACNLQMMRIRIQLITLIRIRLSHFCRSGSGSYLSVWCGSMTLEYFPLHFFLQIYLTGWTFVSAVQLSCFKLISFRVIHPAPGSKFCPFWRGRLWAGSTEKFRLEQHQRLHLQWFISEEFMQWIGTYIMYITFLVTTFDEQMCTVLGHMYQHIFKIK
jgi:hypothetical protein